MLSDPFQSFQLEIAIRIRSERENSDKVKKPRKKFALQ